jgi:hypothetical protein
MIVLGARQIAFSPGAAAGLRSTIRVSTDVQRPAALRAREAFFATSGNLPEGFAWYILTPSVQALGLPDDAAIAHVPDDFGYLADGDVVRLAPNERAVRVLYRRNSPNNSFLLTERCNNY